MSEVVFLLEELCAKVLLENLLPRLAKAEDHHFVLVPFEGKSDMKSQLVRKMRHYRVPDARFVVLRDQDKEACVEVKKDLQALCREAGREGALVRIACHEIESWYLGDLAAMERAFGIVGLAKRQKEERFRDPDGQRSPKQQMQVLVPQYQSVSGARCIGPYLSLERNCSRSFNAFVTGVRRILEP